MENLDNILEKSVKEVKAFVIPYEENIEKVDSVELNILIEKLLSNNRKGIQSIGIKLKRLRDSLNKEIVRVEDMYNFDKSYGYELVAGVDEVGRGPLAGPIVSASVIMDLNYKDIKELILKINDSKKISSKVREELSGIIKERAISYSIAMKDNKEIDNKGIAYCNHQVFLEAIEGLSVKPDLVLSDGYKAKYYTGNNEAVIKGDTKSFNIACASILAKVYRDNLMHDFDKKYPEYDFKKNVGYGTESHIKAIKEHGVTDIHRKTFLNSILNSNMF